MTKSKNAKKQSKSWYWGPPKIAAIDNPIIENDSSSPKPQELQNQHFIISKALSELRPNVAPTSSDEPRLASVAKIAPCPDIASMKSALVKSKSCTIKEKATTQMTHEKLQRVKSAIPLSEERIVQSEPSTEMLSIVPKRRGLGNATANKRKLLATSKNPVGVIWGNSLDDNFGQVVLEIAEYQKRICSLSLEMNELKHRASRDSSYNMVVRNLQQRMQSMQVMIREKKQNLAYLDQLRAAQHFWTPNEANFAPLVKRVAIVSIQGLLRIQISYRALVRKAALTYWYSIVYENSNPIHTFYNIYTGSRLHYPPAGIKKLDYFTSPYMPYQSKQPSWYSAALVIQCRIRILLAKSRIIILAQQFIEPVYDEQVQAYYYFNRKTRRSHWQLPELFTANLTYEASMVDETRCITLLQSWVRGYLVRSAMKTKLQETYLKVHDQESDTYYYYNRTTRKSVWSLPAHFTEDLETTHV